MSHRLNSKLERNNSHAEINSNTLNRRLNTTWEHHNQIQNPTQQIPITLDPITKWHEESSQAQHQNYKAQSRKPQK